MRKDISDIQLDKMLCNIYKAKVPAFEFHAEKTSETRPATAMRKFAPAYITAACLLVFSIVLYSTVGLWQNGDLWQNGGTNHQIANSDIPSWYIPQRLAATTVTYNHRL